MSIVTLLLFVLVFLLIVQYMLNNTKVLTLIKRKKLNGDIHTLLQDYHFNNYKDLRKSNSRKIFIHVPNERNSRKWNDFGGRTSNELNMDLILLCIQSVVHYLGKDYDVILYDNESVRHLIKEENEEDLCNIQYPSQVSGVDLKQWESYCKAKILYIYGGIIMEPHFYFIKTPTLGELFPNQFTICHYANEGLNVSEKKMIPNCHDWISAPKKDKTTKLYMKYKEYLCIHHYSQDHKFFDKSFEKLYTLPYIEPKKMGMIDSKNNVVHAPDLLSKQDLNLDDSLQCLYVNMNYFKTYRKYQWLLRMNKNQLLSMNNYLGEFMNQHHLNI